VGAKLTMRKIFIAIAVLVGLQSWAAVGFVNSGSSTSSATAVTTLSVTYTPTTNNYVVVGIALSTASTGMACADNNSNALTNVQAGAQNPVFQFVGKAVTGATSYTCTWTSAHKASMVIAEYSGVAGIGTSANTSGSNNAPSASLVSTKVNSWNITLFGTQINNTFTATTGNLRVQKNGGASGDDNSLAIGDNAGTATGSTITVAMGMNAANFWSFYGVELYPPQITGNLLLTGVGE
jgi:hypothetical protein